MGDPHAAGGADRGPGRGRPGGERSCRVTEALGNRLTVDQRTLTPLVLVRIQVPQPPSHGNHKEKILAVQAGVCKVVQAFAVVFLARSDACKRK